MVITLKVMSVLHVELVMLRIVKVIVVHLVNKDLFIIKRIQSVFHVMFIVIKTRILKYH